MEVSRIKDLYYVLMKNKLGNHKICKTLIRHGEIRVNDQVITDVRYPVKADDIIMYHHIQLNAQPFVYYMMNKPADYLCANHDKYHQCVIDLIGREDCYCLGRLDIDTTGLLIITNDTSLSKKLLLPQNHVNKKYYVTTKFPLKDELKYMLDEFPKLLSGYRSSSGQIGEQIKELRRSIAHGHAYYYDFKTDIETQRLIFLLDKLIRNMSLLWIGFSKEEIAEYPLY